MPHLTMLSSGHAAALFLALVADVPLARAVAVL